MSKKVYRTRIPLHNKNKQFNLTYGEVFPVLTKFVLPGDIWKLRAGAFIRYMPMLSPVLSECDVFFRFFFTPLRLLVSPSQKDYVEKIITGSVEGNLITSALPEFDTLNHAISSKLPQMSSSWEIMGNPIYHKNSFPCALGYRPSEVIKYKGTNNDLTVYGHENPDNEDGDLAEYFYRAYCKIIWDYFRDENYQSFDGDFEKFYDYMLIGKNGGPIGNITPEQTNDIYSSANDEIKQNGWFFDNDQYMQLQDDMNKPSGDSWGDFWLSKVGGYGLHQCKLWFANLNKDYFISALPWIMKGVQPTINSVMHVEFSNAAFTKQTADVVHQAVIVGNNNGTPVLNQMKSDFSDAIAGSTIQSILNGNNSISDGGFTAQDIRDMFAETRIFERLARTGSRYVEYLSANFGIAPADETLQRPQYLGGFTQPIVTTEVIQTGSDTDNPVGTLRGHGVSSASNRIRPFLAKEFGVIMGLMYVKPKTQYLFRKKREYSYRKRFDFFNPSLQLLSEQQVRKSEFFQIPSVPKASSGNYIAESDIKTIAGVNHSISKLEFPDGVLGYQGMYNELRYDSDVIVRDLADNLGFWNQAINLADKSWVQADYVLNNSTRNYSIPSLNGLSINIGYYLKSLLKPFEGTTGNFKPMIVNFNWSADVYRPMVRNPVPGLVDHH